jgi:hypothetical protein
MESLDAAGRFLMRVRDRAIAHIEAEYAGQMMKSASARRIGELAACLTEEAQRELAIAAADELLATLFYALEEDRSVELRSGDRSLAEISDGLAGELYTEDGWISRFSSYPASTDD